MSAGSQPSDGSHSSPAASVVWILLAVAPFAVIYVAHLMSPSGSPTGFIFYDLPSYAANGREVFERGNGFAFPNPYETSPPAAGHLLLLVLVVAGLRYRAAGIRSGAAVRGGGGRRGRRAVGDDLAAGTSGPAAPRGSRSAVPAGDVGRRPALHGQGRGQRAHGCAPWREPAALRPPMPGCGS